jgi:hypothetical protein
VPPSDPTASSRAPGGSPDGLFGNPMNADLISDLGGDLLTVGTLTGGLAWSARLARRMRHSGRGCARGRRERSAIDAASRCHFHPGRAGRGRQFQTTLLRAS